MFPMPSPVQDERIAQWCIEKGKERKFGTVFYPLVGIIGSLFVFGFGGIFLAPFIIVGGVFIGIYRWTSGNRLEKEGKAIYEALGRPNVARQSVEADKRKPRPLAPNR
jgi:hypothetical protein